MIASSEFWPEASITALTALPMSGITFFLLPARWLQTGFCVLESRAGTESEAVRQQIAM